MRRKNKKGFLGLLLNPYYFLAIIVGLIVLLGLLIWFGYSYDESIASFIDFVSKWWWITPILFLIVIFQAELRAIARTILGWVGVHI